MQVRSLASTALAVALLAGCASRSIETELASLTSESVRASLSPEERLALAHEAWIQAVSLDLRGQDQIALEFVQTAAFYDPDDRHLAISMARRLREFRRSAEALGVLRRALKLEGPESSSEWELAAGLWYEAGKKDSAELAWNRVLELDKNSREALLGKANLAEARGDYATAARSFARLADIYGPNALPLVERAESHWIRVGQPDSAIAMLRSRWKTFAVPREGEKLARHLGSRGRTDEAVALFDSLAEFEPEDGQKYALFSARYLLTSGRRTEALQRFRAILSDDPASAKAKASLGAVLLDLDSLDAASKIFRELVATDSVNATAWYFLGLVAQREGRTDSARQFLDRSLSLDPQAIETWIRRGMLEFEADSTRLASEVFARMVTAWPTLAQARFLYGYSLSRQGMQSLLHPDREMFQPDSEPVAASFRKLAVLQFDTALGIDSLMQRARFERGSLLERLGRLDEALVDLRIAVRLNPGDANTANYLGYLLAEHERSLPESDSLIGSALRQDSANPAYLDSRGWLRFRQGRLAEALQDVEQALSGSDRKDPTIRQHKARILEALGRKSEALPIWKTLLAEDPGDPVNRQARERLGLE